MRRQILLVALMILGGCRSEERQALEEARRQWSAERPSTYEMDTMKSCFCNTPGWLHVRVEGEEVLSFEASDEIVDPDRLPEEAETYFTVEGQFDIIEEAIDAGAYEVVVRYDSELGYPSRIDIDRDRSAVDDESSFQIRSFE